MRVFILAEIRFYRQGLAGFFSSQPGFEVVGSSADAADAVTIATQGGCDIFLIDMTTSACADAARRLSAAAPAACVVALGVHEVERDVIPLVEAGILGFVAREASLDEVVRAVLSAASGEMRCTPRMTAMLARRVATLASHVRDEPPAIPLTSRQLEIVRLIGEGLPNKAIAQRLYIELPTVKNHVHNILERLGVDRRDEAVNAVRALSSGALPVGAGGHFGNPV